MAYFFNILVIIAFLLFQTSVAPKIGFFADFFDLMVVFIVFTAINRPVKESVVFIILMGVLIDSISSSPFGLYITVYLWLYIGIRWIVKYLHTANRVLMPVVIAFVIIFQNILIMSVLALFEKTFYFHHDTLRLIMVQVLWGSILGPLLLILVKNFQIIWKALYFEKVFKFFGQ